jgi:hypothetical protein
VRERSRDEFGYKRCLVRIVEIRLGKEVIEGSEESYVNGAPNISSFWHWEIACDQKVSN